MSFWLNIVIVKYKVLQYVLDIYTFYLLIHTLITILEN